MRKLKTIQAKYLLNHAYATDDPDQSGANHFYTVMDSKDQRIMGQIRFQQGARDNKYAPDGLRDDDLLEIVRDRLMGFQSGPYPCEENQEALEHIELALKALKRRTDDRKTRGVLGQETE